MAKTGYTTGEEHFKNRQFESNWNCAPILLIVHVCYMLHVDLNDNKTLYQLTNKLTILDSIYLPFFCFDVFVVIQGDSK